MDQSTTQQQQQLTGTASGGEGAAPQKQQQQLDDWTDDLPQDETLTEPGASDQSKGEGQDTWTDFETMGLPENLLRGIYEYGFETPSYIQSKAIIPIAVQGRDVIMQSQSGTGKTGAFTIGALYRILNNPERKRGAIGALVLSPTRELAHQTALITAALSAHLDVDVRAFIGGQNVRDDIEALREGLDVASGTPGRIIHMTDRGYMSLRDLQLLIIDEVDEMLAEGFAEQVRTIMQSMPSSAQIVLCSATMSPEMLQLASCFMRDPLQILVKTEQVTLDGLGQYYVDVGQRHHKLDCLCDLYDDLSVAQTIIFVNSRNRAEELAYLMGEKDFTVAVMHGEHSQPERQATLKDFKLGKQRVLIATDVVARGIDVQTISMVVNYELPRDKAKYIHRIGRCARFGRKGVAINLITEQDVRDLRELERYYSTEINPLPRNLAELIA